LPVIGQVVWCRNDGSKTRRVGMSGNDATVGSRARPPAKIVRAHDTITVAS
jgi:hypothetical protein